MKWVAPREVEARRAEAERGVADRIVRVAEATTGKKPEGRKLFF